MYFYAQVSSIITPLSSTSCIRCNSIAGVSLLSGLDMLNTRSRPNLFGHSHLRSISAVWNPLSASHWCRLLQHSVNLFKGETFSLRNQEVCVYKAKDAERAPQEEDLGSEINSTASCGSDIRSNDGDNLCTELVGSRLKKVAGKTYAIPQPVGGG
jgi:hypothetical protein